MVKSLLLLAFTANVFCLTFSSEQYSSSSAVASASSSSSTSYASASSHSSSFSSGREKEDYPPNDEDCDCGPNERRVTCPEAVCVPKTCDDVGFPVPCYDLPPNGKCPSPPACICIEDYVRNKNGQCIPMKKCPSCGGDPNAQSGCGVNCNNRCEKTNNTCIDICYFNACDCKKGYLLDESCNKCVKPSECPKPKCKKNEVYDLCPAPCPLRTCGINDAAVDCVPALEVGDPKCDPPKCRCKDGFYRNNYNECVRLEDCPQCLNPNEEYDPCIAPCPPKVCGVDERLILCRPSPAIGDPSCVAGCRCSEGFYKNDQNVCVPKDQCPVCDKPNEIYDPCIAPCPPRRCDVDDRVIRCAAPPAVGSSECKAGCRCADGFYRNAKGICVTRDDCPLPCKSDEVYEKCPPFLCKPLTCSDLGFNITCPTQEYGCPGNAACICADDKVRDDNGNCIPRNQCPSCRGDPNAVAGCGIYCNKRCRDIGKKPGACIALCEENACDCRDGYHLDENTNQCVLPKQCTRQCGPDEQYNDCINGGCQAKNCSQVGFPIPCPKINYKDCIKGCLCKDGYLRNEMGVCVPKNKCLSCGGDNNAQPGCGINCNKQCSDIGKKEPDACIALCKDNACDCKKGYYYDPARKCCVKPEDCTPTCGINEEYNECTLANCNPQNCTQLGYPIACPRIDPKYCKGGCLCKPGYVRNDKGICIPAKECPSCGGDKNAQSGCGGTCRKRCSDIGRDPRFCTLICQFNGCDCKEGYVIDDKSGKCVKPEQCSNCGGDENALPGCGINCNKQCSDIGKKEPGACITLCKDNACDCKKGYYYDPSKKKCVKPEDCTPQCGKNEEYNECTNANCAPQNCTQVGFPIACPRIDPKYCKKGCQCISGYARNQKGICIPLKECPSCRGDENAQSGCGGYCNRRCSDIGNKPRPCPKICEINGCDCKEGYYHDDNTDKCAKPEYCSPTCGINEVYSECTNANCAAQNCSQLGFPIACPLDDSKSCIKGCQCKPGYVRNNKNICISDKECPSCGGDPNAQSGCGGYCDKRCSDAGSDEPRPCILICKLNGCDCKEGYYRDDNTDRCVKLEDCTPKCGINEEYNECTNANCAPRTCTQLGFPIKCPRIDPTKCIKGCQCKSGYVKNSKNICIPSKECPSCRGDPNATAGCGTNCNQRCSDIGNKPGACAAVCELNGCDCKKGYYYDTDKKICVKPEDCFKCLPENNEVYSDCINGGCTWRNCSQYGTPVACVKLNASSCIKGCVCAEGYLRASDGKCIPQDKCPEACRGPHEVYTNCSYNCPPQTCESLDRAYACPIQTDQNCEPLCKCEHGYYRNKNGQCITEAECRRCMGPHEYYSCGGACDNVCATLKKQNQNNCPIINIKCNEMCYCEKDYARARNGTCIPISCCNEPQCPINERYETCPGASCQPLTCSQLGEPLLCPAEQNYVCPKKPACVCIDGYVRDDKGKCIPVQECPSCGCDPNAQSGCGVNCGKYCRDLLIDDKDGIACIEICYFNACDCKDGYYYDTIQEKCVLPGQCTDICGKNEIFEDCSNPSCRAKNCSELGFPIDCDAKCKKGCICKEDYARNENGICIPVRECPTCGGDPNAQSGCGVNCGKLCPNNNRNPNICPRICYPNACDCKDGFFYDNNTNTCVNKEECSPRCDDLKNEVYDSCINGGCNKKNCSQIGRPDICVRPKKCIQGCSCKEGYLRGADGICVPVEQCPPAGCGGDPNAQPGCGINCGRKCPRETSTKLCPRIVCKPDKCDCKKGFLYDSNIKKCVKPEDCSPVCDTLNNEVYDFCVGAGCDKRNCSQLGSPDICIDKINCEQGCKCKEGYLRLNNGTCVPIDKCPQPKCKKNERFEKCPARVCEPQTCSVVGYPIDCPIIEDDQCGYPTCICDYGYVRNSDGICIPIKDCPGCGGDPNAEPGCGLNCNKQCPKKTNGKCPRIACKRNGCECKEGFLYDRNIKKCVRQKYCSPICDASNYEVYDSCVNGGCNKRNCSQLERPDICIDPIRCEKGCSCKRGYLRLNNGKCVPVDQCPKPRCKKNERFEKCPGKVCEPQTCSVVGYPMDCCDDEECGLPACICEEGYARDDDGYCVPIDDCPTCGGDPNAKPGCGYHCPNRCPKAINREFCPRLECQPKSCDCKDGFLYDENTKTCVEPGDCSPICDTLNNEVYDPCVNGYCGWKNCSQVGGPQYCVDVTKCEKGCSCKENYYRLDNGTCVPEDQCPPNCRAPNEVYDPCIPYCSPQTCRTIGQKLYCPRIPVNSTCQGAGCRCKPGYFRNAINECISREECLQCTGENEYFSCGPYCDNVCGKLDTESKDNCSVKTLVCVKRCYCEDGHARNDKGICIPISQCPECPPPTTSTRKPKTTTTVKPNTPPSVNVTTSIADFQQGNQILATKFLYQMLQNSDGKSFVFSTLSLLNALAQLIVKAEGSNLKQLLNLYNLDEKEQIEAIFPILIQGYKEQRDVMFKIANKVYGNGNYPFSDDYMKLSKNIFDAQAENIDFGQNVQAAQTINKWVSDQTNALIQNLIDPSMLNEDTRLVVLNCIYFLGDWLRQFKEDNTKDRDFFVSDTKTIQTKIMSQNGRFKYGEDQALDCKLLELPYKGGNFSLLILLPNKKTGLLEMAKSIEQDSSLLNKAINSMTYEDCNVYLPKMNIRTRMDLIPMLQKAGVTEAFKPGATNFKGILKTEEPLYITDIIQEAVIKVDEKGTEAAAATAIVAKTLSAIQSQKTYTFDADHPFSFMLFYEGSTVTFVGSYLGMGYNTAEIN